MTLQCDTAYNMFIPSLIDERDGKVCKKEHKSGINTIQVRSLRKICGVALVDSIHNIEVKERS